MTGYTIRRGYMSGPDWDRADALMRSLAVSLPQDTARLFAEVSRFPFTPGVEGEEMWDFCAIYRKPWDQHGPLRLIEDPDDGPTIGITASGGGKSREMKEQVARAFVRLVIEEMHRRGYEVCVSVH